MRNRGTPTFRMLRRASTLALVLVALAATARAHTTTAIEAAAWWRSWEIEPAIAAGLFAVAALYATGLRWLRRATRTPDKLKREAFCFFLGWIGLVVALISPVHPLGRVLFSMHMTQHELLMVIAAPLLMLGRPTLVMLWACPRRCRRTLTGAWRYSGGASLSRTAENPFVASLVHALALWLWHVPVLFQATATSDLVHAAQHVSFLGTALLFWQAVFFGPRREAGSGLALLMLFFTAMHSGALGALITFAARVWYPIYAETTGAWGLTALEDQQLGGLIMWIPAGLVYVVAALALFARWLRVSDHMLPPIVHPVAAKPTCASSLSS